MASAEIAPKSRMADQSLVASGYRFVAWNQISFQAPDSWDPAEVGSRYLRFFDRGEPRLEIKWSLLPDGTRIGRRPLATVFPRGKQSPASIREIAIPDAWIPVFQERNWPNDRRNAIFFSWEDSTRGGTGGIWSLGHACLAVLVHLTHPLSENPLPVGARILRSLTVSYPAGLLPWALFDFQAAVPGRFGFDRLRYAPGLLRFCLKARHQELSLWRWNPASVLLNGSDLTRFVRDRFDIGVRGIFPADAPGPFTGQAVEWITGPRKRAIWPGVLPKAVRPWSGRGMLWRLEEKDRILAVNLRVREPEDLSILPLICRSYTCI